MHTPPPEDPAPLFFSDIPATCLSGTATVWTASGLQTIAVYSRRAIVDYLVAEGMSEEDAHEHIDFNMVGGYVSDLQPIIVWEADPEEVLDILS